MGDVDTASAVLGVLAGNVVLADGERVDRQRWRPARVLIGPVWAVIVDSLTMEHEPFLQALLALPERHEYSRSDLLVPEFLLAVEGSLAMYYAPFGVINRDAKVAIIGITPGWTQMEIAYRVVRREVIGGTPLVDAMRRAKHLASFAGTMRSHLVGMLDTIGLHRHLGLQSSLDLFGASNHLLHTTSAVRYPVFAGPRNYTGSRPPPLQSELLMQCIRDRLVPELFEVSRAMLIPLGKQVDSVLERLEQEGRLPPGRRLSGLPHPSGANGHRVRQFNEREDELRRRVASLLT